MSNLTAGPTPLDANALPYLRVSRYGTPSR